MKRSISALFCSFFFCASLLSGCGGTNSTTSPSASATQQPTAPVQSILAEATPTQTAASPTPYPTNARPADSDVTQSGGIIIIGNKGYELFYNDKGVCNDYIDAVNQLTASLHDDVTVYSLISPTSIEFNAPPKYQGTGYSAKNAIDYMYDGMQGVKTVDAYSAIEQHQTKYVYFGTDHHWTARGAYYAYTAFCQAAGFDAPDALDTFKTGRLDNFLGLYYSLSNSDALKNNPDYVEYFLPKVDTEATAFSDSNLQNPTSIKVVNTDIESGNKYMAFISGDRPLIRIQTSANTGRKILLIKESYGNAFAPYLTANYDEVWVLDPRETTFSLDEFLQKQEIDEVLILNYAIGTTSQGYRDNLRALI